MDSSAISETSVRTGTMEYASRLLSNDRAEVAEEPQSPNHAARGAVTGILLGASLWAVILALFGVIKL
jgi:hypothetical protein